MKSTTTDLCRLCSIGKSRHINGNVDKPIHETPNYMVIPSIGAFIDGWVMIVPRKHIYDMSELYEDDEFVRLALKIYKYIEEKFGRTVMFEHGASYSGSPTGCGVDHAHFHFVPFVESLLEDLKETRLPWQKCIASEITNKSCGRDYLFYSETPPTLSKINGYLHIVDRPVSQFFRKILARKTGNELISDYKNFPLLEKTQRTALELQGLS